MSQHPYNNSSHTLKIAIVAIFEGKYDRDSPSVETQFIQETPQRGLFRPIVRRAIAIAYLLLLVYPAHDLYQTHAEFRQTQNSTTHQLTQTRVLGIETSLEKPGLPVRLKIPRIQVDALIEKVGVTPEGSMAVPSNTVDVGWFNLGSRPGEQGSAVIAGHLTTVSGSSGVFAHLSKLREGDNVSIEDDNGKLRTFVVRGSRTYDSGYADNVFGSNSGTHLNLITCEGLWDTVLGSYSKRLVVFTDLIE